MHNCWIDSKHIIQLCFRTLKNMSGYNITVAKNNFFVLSNYAEIEYAIADFYETEYSTTNNNIIIIHITQNNVNYLKTVCKTEKENETDFYVIQCEKGTWLLYSSYLNIGVSLCINTAEDQWKSPIIEQMRWHIATHIMHRLEEDYKYCFHSSAIKKDNQILLLFGYSESGKSTLVARALANGWRLLSDDRVVFSMKEDTLWVEPFWRSLKLRGDVGHLKEIFELKKKQHIVISKYEEETHGISTRYVFEDLLDTSGGELQKCYFISNETNNPHIVHERYLFVNDALMTFGATTHHMSLRRRAFIGKMINKICSLPFNVIEPTNNLDGFFNYLS